MRGIVGFQYSHNVIRRWYITSTQRRMSVTELRCLAGLETTQLRVSRIGKDGRQMDAFFNAVTESCDPFSLPASTYACLLNIATGREAS